MLRAGDMDRRVELQRATQTGLNDFGEPVISWVTFATVAAKVSEELGREFLSRESRTTSSESAAVFLIRWRGDVLVTDRAVYAGRTFNIAGTREIGRREGLEIKAVEQR